MTGNLVLFKWMSIIFSFSWQRIHLQTLFKKPSPLKEKKPKKQVISCLFSLTLARKRPPGRVHWATGFSVVYRAESQRWHNTTVLQLCCVSNTCFHNLLTCHQQERKAQSDTVWSIAWRPRSTPLEPARPLQPSQLPVLGHWTSS